MHCFLMVIYSEYYKINVPDVSKKLSRKVFKKKNPKLNFLFEKNNGICHAKI